jgi:hypothetical protein
MLPARSRRAFELRSPRITQSGEIVYYLPPRCCGIWSNLYQADGTIGYTRSEPRGSHRSITDVAAVSDLA